MKKYSFKQAVPVWEQGKEREMNYHLVFRCIVPKAKDVTIALSASCMYQMFVNGNFVSEGPARAGHDFYRVDEIDIGAYLDQSQNVVSIYVAGYYVESFYLLKLPSFLCAEVLSGGKVIAATGGEGFVAKYNENRARLVSRFSYQRTFNEYYQMDPADQDFDRDPTAAFTPVTLVCVESKSFLYREVPYPCYERFFAKNVIARGSAAFGNELVNPNRGRYVDCKKDCVGFSLDEIQFINSDEVEKGCYTITDRLVATATEADIPANGFSIYHFGQIRTGFLSLQVTAKQDTELMLVFTELLNKDQDISTRDSRDTIPSVIWELKAGTYHLISNEPYGLQYLKIINKSAAPVHVSTPCVISYIFDCNVPTLETGNQNLNRIFDAAVQTFKQNTLDIYMDCVSRERAGWLCDSYFTSRVEHALTGRSLVEKNFLENFLMVKKFEYIPDGMLPMCYPADHLSTNFIPNWAMWFVLELEEYLYRTGDRELIDFAKEKVFKLVRFFESLENENGLLEHLPMWVFVEWSKANSFTQDVNYPSNMLYARMLRSVGKLYDEAYFKKAANIEQTIRDQSYFEGFFHDHAVRNEHGLLTVIPEDVTETCQYYAFYMGTATKEAYPELWARLVNDFGPNRAKEGKWPEIYPSNAFIGNYLRLELLMAANLKENVLREIEGYFSMMAETTGTLWENQQPGSSCNHGFASHVLVWLYKIFN